MSAQTQAGTAPGAVTMRASLAADLADACRIIERVKAAAHLAGFQEPSDLSVFRGTLVVHRSALTRLQCQLHEMTFAPSVDSGEEG